MTQTTKVSRPTRRSAFWLWAAVCLACALMLGVTLGPPTLMFFDGARLGLLVLIPVLLAGFWYFRRLNPIRSYPRSHALLMTAWGVFAALGMAIPVNQAVESIIRKATGLGFADRWADTMTAPIDEELLKLTGVVLLALMAPRAIRGPLDGFVYGALVGFGCQVAEDYLYVFNAITANGAVHPTSSALGVLALRVGYSTWWSHWAMTAVSGAGLGYLIGETGRPLTRRLLVAAGAFLLALVMHAWQDSPVLSDDLWGMLVKGPPVLIIAVVVYRAARRRYLARFRDAAAAEADRGVLTAAETEVLAHRRNRRRERRRTPRGTRRRLLTDLRSAELNLIDEDLNGPGASTDLRSDVVDLRSRLETMRR
jgi:RsiW-degrading membrane proteinase PrsW (M82 family)